MGGITKNRATPIKVLTSTLLYIAIYHLKYSIPLTMIISLLSASIIIILSGAYALHRWEDTIRSSSCTNTSLVGCV